MVEYTLRTATATLLVLRLFSTVQAAVINNPYALKPSAFYSEVTPTKHSAPVSNDIAEQKKNGPKPQYQPVQEKGVFDRFSHRYPDGSYEYRYELEDGTARYERGYFLIFDKVKTLVVVGYYSYRMTDGRFVTVFYNADQYGYRQNQSITPHSYPNLPRTIEVPQFKDNSFSNSNNNHKGGI